MATTTDFTKGTAGAGYPASDLPVFFLIENTLDYAASNGGAADIAQLLNVKADTFVLLAGLELLTLEGGVLTLDMGDGVDPNGFLDGVDGNATAGDTYVSVKNYIMTSTAGDFDNEAAVSAENIYSNVGGRFYQANDTIDLINVNAADLAKLRVFAAVLALKP